MGSASTGLYGNLLFCTWPTWLATWLTAPSVNNGTGASALFVVNGGTKIPLVATGTGKNFVLSYNNRELFPVWYETLDIEPILLPFAVQTYITFKIFLLD